MDAGTWAEWVTGFVTFAAVAVAVWAFLDERSRYRDTARQLAQERTQTHVSRVLAYASPDYVDVADAARPDKPDRKKVGWSLVVRNGSSEPLLRWHAEVLDFRSGSTLAELCWLDSELIPPALDHEEERISLPEELLPMASYTTTVLTFQDGAGKHWRRSQGRLKPLDQEPEYCCRRSACQTRRAAQA